jgi:hypothetical protein
MSFVSFSKQPHTSQETVGKPERKRQLGRYRRSWEGNIEMDPKEIRFENVDWTYLPHNGGQ